MISFVLVLVLLAICLLGVAIQKVYNYLPAKELKRQAEAGDALAQRLWRVVSYGISLRAYMWLWIGLTAAAGFLVLARVAPWPFGLGLTVLVIWLAFAWFPARPKVSGVEARLARMVTPVVAWQLHYLHPLLDRLVGLLVRRPQASHTNLYETADLLELLDKQQAQADNRISEADIERAKLALTAHQHKVSDVLIPRQKIKTISDNDTIGLVMLDELHATGQPSFPVCHGNTDKIVGTLYLHDLGLKTEGRVSDYMQSGVKYLHEDDTLDQALQAFYKTRQQSFVVVNSFEEYVGIATLEGITRQLAGEAGADDFDQHQDVAAVAAKHAHDDESEPEPEIVDVTAEPDEVALPAPEDEVLPAVVDEPSTEEVSDDDFEVIEEEPEPAASAEVTDAKNTPPNQSDLEPLETNDEQTEPNDEIDPDNLAALDLPEDEAEPAKLPKEDKVKTKPAKTGHEVVE